MSSDKYNHTEVENRIYSYWEKNKLFQPRKNITSFKKYQSTRKDWLILAPRAGLEPATN